MFFDEIREAPDLLEAVFQRNRDEDRLVEPSADELHLSHIGQPPQQVEEFRMVRLHPFQQRAAVVQAHADRGMPAQRFYEREVGLLVSALEHVFKIADWLVRVD